MKRFFIFSIGALLIHLTAVARRCSTSITNPVSLIKRSRRALVG